MCLSFATDDTCNGISHEERDQVTAWHKFTKHFNKTWDAGTDFPVPLTAMLVGLHNMVTQSVTSDYIAPARRKFYCPAEVLSGLKSGIFSNDEMVRQFYSSNFTEVPGVPGLAIQHRWASCNSNV